ncbi:MAG: hypothetical protein VW378_08090 [bacterium]
MFDRHKIIPQFCFGCFKVQVQTETVIDLIKLFLIFDNLLLKQNNTRKCIIELRPQITGFYKGLIYCSSSEQANKIKTNVERVVRRRIGNGPVVKVKRGCSEYSLEFPEYEIKNAHDQNIMSYQKSWREVEETFDINNGLKAIKTNYPTISGLNLNDVLIIQNWLMYAVAIGDKSAPPMHEINWRRNGVYEQAERRIKFQTTSQK